MPVTSWITPRTFVDGLVPNASQMNEITTDLSILGTLDAARIYNTTSQTIGQSSWTTIAFNAEYLNRGGMHSFTVAPNRLTTQRSGLFAVGGEVIFGGVGATAGVQLLLNATTVIGTSLSSSPGASASQHLCVATLWYATAGDFFNLQGFNSSPSSTDRTIVGPNSSPTGPASPALWAVWLSN